MLKVLNGVRFAQDDPSGDIYLIKAGGEAIKLTDAAKLSSIAVTTAPTKTSYVAGQTFDSAGMVVTATYDDGSTADITGYTYVPTGALATTDTKVTVSYKGKSANQTITVVARAAASIAITTPPTKTAYTAGETFDATGMVVTATFNDESTEAVTGYTCTPTTALATTDTEVTVTYETLTATQAITVTE